MNFIKKMELVFFLSCKLSIPSWFLGKYFQWWECAVIAIIAGMIITMFWNDKKNAEAGIKWTSKTSDCSCFTWIWNESRVIFQTGKQSLPIIICTITTSLVIAWILKSLKYLQHQYL